MANVASLTIGATASSSGYTLGDLKSAVYEQICHEFPSYSPNQSALNKAMAKAARLMAWAETLDSPFKEAYLDWLAYFKDSFERQVEEIKKRERMKNIVLPELPE